MLSARPASNRLTFTPPPVGPPVPVFGGVICRPPVPPLGWVAVAGTAVLVGAGVTGTGVCVGASVGVVVGVCVLSLTGVHVGTGVSVGCSCRLPITTVPAAVGVAVGVAVVLHGTGACVLPDAVRGDAKARPSITTPTAIATTPGITIFPDIGFSS